MRHDIRAPETFRRYCLPSRPRGCPLKTYVIGDVHGRADLLKALPSHIEENDPNGCGYRVIFLGDIIDRGPDSMKAMEMVVRELNQNPESRLILGNHEEFMLLFLDRPDKREIVFDHWMRNGGLAAAASYGLNVGGRYGRIEEAHESLLELLHRRQNHIDAMRRAASLINDGANVFVHAGLRPGVPFEQQTTKDLRTIRSGFLDNDFDFGAMVVHGHTVTSSGLPEIRRSRIALDTGAGAGGCLSMMMVDDDGARTFFQSGSAREVVKVELSQRPDEP
ncbi:putative phosphatase [Rhizobium johnstonii 3841]|uniref:Phosphatase n=1 Tax=Rhizobium johnstonii (strain DSM 114642 / LMG 32736 / 3841) TaxID=216596 RepID=Q1MHX9_RHIJ3|nr:putative phosphatase [Rhizobium johnstonii 3841]